MATLAIYSRDDGVTYQADFQVVRRARGYALGWATVRAADATLRFPAIHAESYGAGWVATVSDWQAPWHDTDLSDRAEVAAMMRTGQGRFVAARSGGPTTAGRHFG
jgi:hypothetical protein